MINNGNSVVIVGESGSGKTHLAQLVSANTRGIYAVYTGSSKQLLLKIANSCGAETTVPTAKSEKPMTVDELKNSIAESLEVPLIVDNVHRWPASLKYWLETLLEAGKPMLLLGTKRDLEGLSFKIPKINLPPLQDSEIRSLLLGRCNELGLALPSYKISDLCTRAGGNPMLAYRLLDELDNGELSNDGNHYIDVGPMLMAELALLAAIRFIGLATNDKSLYIIGGLSLTLFVAFKYLLRLVPREDRRR